MFRPFAADDPALHVVGGDVDGADGGLGGVRRGVALDGGGEDLAGLLLAGLAERLLVLEDQAADLVPELVLEPSEEQVAGLLGAELGLIRWSASRCSARTCLTSCVAAVQLLLLLGEVALDGLELAFLLVDHVELLVEQVGALLEPSLLLAEVAAGLLDLGVDGLAAAEGLFLGLEVGLLADRLGLAAGVGEDLLGEAPGGPGPEPGVDQQRRPRRPTTPTINPDQDPDSARPRRRLAFPHGMSDGSRGPRPGRRRTGPTRVGSGQLGRTPTPSTTHRHDADRRTVDRRQAGERSRSDDAATARGADRPPRAARRGPRTSPTGRPSPARPGTRTVRDRRGGTARRVEDRRGPPAADGRSAAPASEPRPAATTPDGAAARARPRGPSSPRERGGVSFPAAARRRPVPAVAGRADRGHATGHRSLSEQAAETRSGPRPRHRPRTAPPSPAARASTRPSETDA